MHHGKIFLTRYEQSPFGKLGNTTIDTMVHEAGLNGLDDLDRTLVDHVAIAGMLTPLLNDQTLLAGLVAMDEAYRAKSIKGVGNACDSGGLAVLDCVAQILSGQAHVALAIGLEKMHPLEGKLDSKKIGIALGTAAHHEDVCHPYTFPHAFAMFMHKYMDKYGYTEEQFAEIPPALYENASHNPLAHMHKTKEPVTAEAVLKSYRLFQDPPLPLKLFECSQVSDGWARLLVCDEQGLADLGIPRDQATELVGWGQATDGLAISSRGEDLLRPVAAGAAYQKAMKMAGAAPNELSFAEIHDCFSVMVPLAAEITGLTDAGSGLNWWLEGNGKLGGKCPINTSGGLIAKGHPISATGVAMIGWSHQQLLGLVPDALKVPDAKLGTTLNIGGPICSTVVTAQRPAV